jgi:hypothetical protein
MRSPSNPIPPGPEPREIFNIRQFLQQGQVGKTKYKKKRGQKKIFIWISENLSTLYWSSGKTQNITSAIEKSTFLNAVDIHDVTNTVKSKTKFRIQYFTAGDGSKLECRDFDVSTNQKRNQWVKGLEQLKEGSLDYRLEGSSRDQGTVVSIAGEQNEEGEQKTTTTTKIKVRVFFFFFCCC